MQRMGEFLLNWTTSMGNVTTTDSRIFASYVPIAIAFSLPIAA
jgi:hypothetical protein